VTNSSRAPLGPVTLLALGVNGIVGVGIFVAPSIVARAVAGPRGAVLYVAVAVACAPIAWAYARLSRAHPEDGGPTLYAERAFGARAAIAIGVLAWISALFSTAAVTRALCERLPGAPHATGIAITIALAALNLRGLRPSAWTWTVLTVTKLVPIAVVALLGNLHRTGTDHGPPAAIATGALGPALLSILFALQGFEIVTLPAGQARDAARWVPRATIASLVIAGALYAAVHAACARLLPDLAGHPAPIAAVATEVAGPGSARLLEVGILASMGGIVVGMHAMTPRYLAAVLAAAARARGEVARERPATTIAGSAGPVALLVATSALSALLDLSSIAVLAQYAITALALRALARRRAAGLAPRDAWPTFPALVVVAVLILQARPWEIATSAIVVGIAALAAGRLLRARGG
jgi:amino acid transporter